MRRIGRSHCNHRCKTVGGVAVENGEEIEVLIVVENSSIASSARIGGLEDEWDDRDMSGEAIYWSGPFDRILGSALVLCIL